MFLFLMVTSEMVEENDSCLNFLLIHNLLSIHKVVLVTRRSLVRSKDPAVKVSLRRMLNSQSIAFTLSTHEWVNVKMLYKNSPFMGLKHSVGCFDERQTSAGIS